MGITKVLKFGNIDVVRRLDTLFPAFITETQTSGMPGLQFAWMVKQRASWALEAQGQVTWEARASRKNMGVGAE